MSVNKGIERSITGLLQIGCLFILLFSCLPYLSEYQWYFELLTHFRLQYFFVSCFLLVIFIFVKAPWFIAISSLSLLINTLLIAPNYVTVLALNESTDSKPIKIFHSNVLTSNTQYSALVNQVLDENPDVVLLQEVDDLWIKNLDVIRGRYKYKVEVPQDNNFGMALYSKIAIAHHQIEDWGNVGVPSIEARLLRDDKPFYILATHPVPPVSELNYKSRNAQIKRVSDRIKVLNTAKVLIGDLNVTAWSNDYKSLEANTGLTNVRNGFGIIPTWPTGAFPMMIPIDHCLVSKHFNVVDVRSGKNIGSDHLPLIVELTL